jgi:hypothetical protein
VVKALDAPYHLGLPSSKSPSWIKWKRDYDDLSWDVDALIVGGMYGNAGKHGGITKYVCALRNASEREFRGRLFLTFARVYTGLTVRRSCCLREVLQQRRDVLLLTVPRGLPAADTWYCNNDFRSQHAAAHRCTVSSATRDRCPHRRCAYAYVGGPAA